MADATARTASDMPIPYMALIDLLSFVKFRRKEFWNNISSNTYPTSYLLPVHSTSSTNKIVVLRRIVLGNTHASLSHYHRNLKITIWKKIVHHHHHHRPYSNLINSSFRPHLSDDNTKADTAHVHFSLILYNNIV